MIGRKIYYELLTGDVILVVPEKHGSSSINTTKEQDFQMYDVLAARCSENVGVIQLNYGQHRADFQSSCSVKVDIETENLLFEYPVYMPSLMEQIAVLENTNVTLRQQVDDLNIALAAIMGGAV